MRRYDAIMEKIEVTDGMRARILSNLREVEIEGVSPGRTRRHPAVRMVLSAACLVILLTGALVLPRLMQSGPAVKAPDHITGVQEMVRAATVEELSALVGFALSPIPTPPFQVENTAYTAYRGELAEIRWQGEGETAVFRKSLGEEDNSGDYTMYSEEKEVAVGNLTVTLKGDDGAYPLAVWSDDGYACSLRVTCAMTVEEWTSVLAAC